MPTPARYQTNFSPLDGTTQPRTTRHTTPSTKSQIHLAFGSIADEPGGPTVGCRTSQVRETVDVPRLSRRCFHFRLPKLSYEDGSHVVESHNWWGPLGAPRFLVTTGGGQGILGFIRGTIVCFVITFDLALLHSSGNTKAGVLSAMSF